MVQHTAKILFALGLSYLLALLVSRIVIQWRIPKVTGYLLVGLFIGPSVTSFLGLPSFFTDEMIQSTKILSTMALALIMFAIGAQFKSDSLRRWNRGLVIHSFSEITATFLMVGLSTILVNFFVIKTVLDSYQGLLISSIYLGLFIGIISMATAPAATLLVIREYESEGPVTELVMALVGINNLLTIFIFIIAEHLILKQNVSDWLLLHKLLTPIALGGLIGLFLGTWAQRLESNIEYQLLLFGGIIFNVGLSQLFGLDIFLSCFFIGMILANASPKASKLLQALQSIDYPLYVIFFILAGASLHIETLTHLGLLGITYIFMRIGGKLAGNWIGAKLAKFDHTTQKWIGSTMLAQAGVAIGLASVLNMSWESGGHFVQTIILGSVVIFELVGPIAIRHGLVHAGEVPVLTLLAKRAPETALEGFHHVVEHFRNALGMPIGHRFKSPHDILVKHVMRKNVSTIQEDAPFNEILIKISHDKYDRFPIVDNKNNFLGMIDYRDIRDIIVDESLKHLIVAKDLVNIMPLALFPDQTLGEALRVFQSFSDITYLPVVDRENPKILLGMINQNDLLAAFRIKNE